jgi:hypothetical protein
MIRATAYLLVAGAIWFVEGFLFSRFLDFSTPQVVGMAIGYAALYACALWALLHSAGPPGSDRDVAQWRYVSLAPMLTVVLGSFASLPIMIVIALLGKVL